MVTLRYTGEAGAGGSSWYSLGLAVGEVGPWYTNGWRGATPTGCWGRGDTPPNERAGRGVVCCWYSSGRNWGRP